MTSIFNRKLSGVAAVCLFAMPLYALDSPNGAISIDAGIDADGHPCYSVTYRGVPVIAQSSLGIVTDEMDFSKASDMAKGEVVSRDTVWTPVWGEYETIRDNYNELPVTYRTPGGATMKVVLRAYDDGVAFRYEIPEQTEVNYMTVRKEQTEFKLADDFVLTCIPGDYDTDERLYTTTSMSGLGRNMEVTKHNEGTPIPVLSVQTPLLAKHPDRPLYVNIHEAALQDYPAMALEADTASLSLRSHLTPDKNGVMAYVQAPFETPWRTIIISDDARDILASQLILNLNAPCAIEDTSWIKPMKYIGIWWEYFLGWHRTWAYSTKPKVKLDRADFSKLECNGHHPANTANALRYIDFAAANGIDGVLVEGWNKGWDDWTYYRKNRLFLFDSPYPDFDVDSVSRYAAEKGVKLIMHHETGGNVSDYERQLDKSFRFMNRYGYPAVKTGYVGFIIPRSEYHSSQWMIDHYLHVVKTAADYKIMVNSHEATRPTGMCRTWPNWIAQESARGGEFEAFGGNTPEHTCILPFTRLKGGPMDYTPGLFETDLDVYGEGKDGHANTTLARQLALYVTMASPLQMACDLPENYEKFADAFQFIRDVPVDWSDTKWLEAAPGDYITVARRRKGGKDWFVGGITDENARTATVDFSFLPAGKKFEARIYEDTPDADFRTNRKSYRIRTAKVDSKTRLKQWIAPGGGFAMSLTPVK